MAVIRALPERARDASDWTPSTCESACSMGSTIWRSTAGGDAPGQERDTVIVRLSTSGYWLTPIRVSATIPKSTVDAIIIHAKTGFLIETSVMFKARRERLPGHGEYG